MSAFCVKHQLFSMRMQNKQLHSEEGRAEASVWSQTSEEGRHMQSVQTLGDLMMVFCICSTMKAFCTSTQHSSVSSLSSSAVVYIYKMTVLLLLQGELSCVISECAVCDLYSAHVNVACNTLV
ncbi:hypothetical protein JOB18_013164 [Solea senegalensis]|uniref:Uncharacterized protein n=1 Tax=Solea senegalensis TaxID=28829 RepID=A0AAV6SGN5_SOLSE|nr:hypothetical protein JOB18_013164 [Solea senegalensis]